jgi:hypothetical protein
MAAATGRAEPPCHQGWFQVLSLLLSCSLLGIRFAPFLSVDWIPCALSSCSVQVFMSHGGAGSLFEALMAGVPLLVFPRFGDQVCPPPTRS